MTVTMTSGTRRISRTFISSRSSHLLWLDHPLSVRLILTPRCLRTCHHSRSSSPEITKSEIAGSRINGRPKTSSCQSKRVNQRRLRRQMPETGLPKSTQTCHPRTGNHSCQTPDRMTWKRSLVANSSMNNFKRNTARRNGNSSTYLMRVNWFILKTRKCQGR